VKTTKPVVNYNTKLEIELAELDSSTGAPSFNVTRTAAGAKHRWRNLTASQVNRLQRCFMDDMRKTGALVPDMMSGMCLEECVKEHGLTLKQLDKAFGVLQSLGMEVV
jgi:hypothetical protein